MTGEPPRPALVEPVVVDTNVVSYFLRHDSRGDRYLGVMASRRPFLSFQTVEELRFGALRAGWGAGRMANLEACLSRYEVFHSTGELALTSARLRRRCRAAGHTLDTADAWIAATAVLLDCPLLSNDRGFAVVPDLKLIQEVR